MADLITNWLIVAINNRKKKLSSCSRCSCPFFTITTTTTVAIIPLPLPPPDPLMVTEQPTRWLRPSLGRRRRSSSHCPCPLNTTIISMWPPPSSQDVPWWTGRRRWGRCRPACCRRSSRTGPFSAWPSPACSSGTRGASPANGPGRRRCGWWSSRGRQGSPAESSPPSPPPCPGSPRTRRWIAATRCWGTWTWKPGGKAEENWGMWSRKARDKDKQGNVNMISRE